MRGGGYCNILALVFALSSGSVASAQGLQLFGIGSVNRSMAGASVAAPLDAIGALHWNPATISGLPSGELAAGMELITPDAKINSTVPAGALGPGFPTTTLHGHDESKSGWTGIPSIGLVLQQPESPLSFGVGLYGVAGYGLNYGASTTNPIGFPQAPTPVTPIPGFGRIHADVQLFQIATVASMQITPRISVGIGPTIMLAKLTSIPFPFASPDDANMDGTPTFPDGDGTRFHWGGGFEAGVFYKGPRCWNFGASLKSKNWFETVGYRSHDELGLPRDFDIDIEYPMILSLGAAYVGFERFLFASDVRWTEFSQTATFGDSPRFDNGRLIGLGWENIWSVAVGMQYKHSESLSLRTGYSYSESPITNETAGFNAGAPVVLRHSVNVGASYRLGANISFHASYHHIIPSDVSGTLQSTAGPVPGTNVTYSIGAHAITAGITSHF